MKPDKEYLKQLIEFTKQKYDEFEYPDLDLSKTEVTYIPTKKRNYMGIKLGIDGLEEMKKYKVKETAKIRSNCMFYHKYYKIDNKIIKIESFVSGHDRITNNYIAYYEGDYRYLFPFYKKEKATGLYIFVTHFENNQVIEEYMISQNQIVYDKYEYFDHNKVKYYYINYVPTGKYPVLGESKGYYLLDSLEYIEEEKYVWYEDI